MKFCPKCDGRFGDELSLCPQDGAALVFVPNEEIVGKVIDNRFKIVRRLGEGGMGTVYQAHQFSVNREVALKVVRAELANSEKSIKRFMREAQAASRLRNPNTIKVFDFGQTQDGLLFMAMELLRGTPLDKLLAREAPLTIPRVVHILSQVCNSLEEAHEEGIVHRDLKPANLVVEDRAGFRDFVTVLDFGIARIAGDNTEEALTSAGTVVGSPRYMSPEQVWGAVVDRRADLYSLGVIAYEMLSGHCPFEGGTSATVMSRHCTEQPLSLRATRPRLGIPTSLDQFLLSCLAKNPSGRPATAAEFKARLSLCSADTIETPEALLSITETGIAPAMSDQAPAVVTGEEATACAAADELSRGGTGAHSPVPTASPPAPTVTLAPPTSEKSVGGQQAPVPPAAPDIALPRREESQAPVARRSWLAPVTIAAALLGLAVVAVLLLHQGTTSESASKPAPLNLPPRPILVIAGFASSPERVVDQKLWPLADRVLFNAISEGATAATCVRPVDPLKVSAAANARELSGALAPDSARELGAALGADAVLLGEIERTGGKVVVKASLLPVAGDGAVPLEGAGNDLFQAAGELTAKLCRALPSGSSEAHAGTAEALPEPFGTRWRELTGDPWTESRYAEFAGAAGGASDPALKSFAMALATARGETNQCLSSAGAAAAAFPATIGPLAEAVCHGRRMDYVRALPTALRAFQEPALRRQAAAYITKIDSQGRSQEERLRFLEQRVALFPDDFEAWWLLGLLLATTGSEGEAGPVAQVASALSLGREVSFPVALNALRTTMQLRDLAEASRWLEVLERVEARSDWELLWRACRKSGLLQLRGRFADAQAVLRQALTQLASQHGDPYTIAATALFYSHIHFGQLELAAEVAAEFGRLFGETNTPDRWSARMIGLALRRARGELSPSDFLLEAQAVRRELEKAAGEAGKREADGSFCLALAHADAPEETRSHFLQADPANTMVAACRVVAAQVDLEGDKATQAREGFARAQSDILYRSDWSYEFYLPAMLGEAMATERTGDLEAAARLYRKVVEQYREADRDLPEVTAAALSLSRLSSAR